MQRLFHGALFLTLFLIPSSLAFHWDKQAGLVHGVLVDYRIPQISLSALALVITIMLYRYTRPDFRLMKKTIAVAIATTMVFQSLIAIFQFLFQQSIARYWMLGEVALKGQSVVHGEWLNHTIVILPYGTTLHPNILAGAMVVLWLVWWHIARKNREWTVLLFAMTLLICFLTQSLTATAALLVALCLLKFPQCCLLLITVPLLSVVFFAQPRLSTVANTSIQRRAQLEQIAIAMTRKHPITGVGWNNFTLYQEQYGYVSSTVRFLQPVHNVFILLVAEIGILGWLINGALLVLFLRLRPHWAPLAGALIVLGSFDHYLLTLTTGRMLVLLVVGMMILEEKSCRGYGTKL